MREKLCNFHTVHVKCVSLLVWYLPGMKYSSWRYQYPLKVFTVETNPKRFIITQNMRIWNHWKLKVWLFAWVSWTNWAYGNWMTDMKKNIKIPVDNEMNAVLAFEWLNLCSSLSSIVHKPCQAITTHSSNKIDIKMSNMRFRIESEGFYKMTEK